MIFADLVAGDSLFVDANTLVYHCTLDPNFGRACTDLLDRIGCGEIAAFTSTHILLEVCHRLMTLEAARKLGKPQGPMVKFLKSHLDEILQLSRFRQAIDDLCHGQLQILTISSALVPTIAALSQQIGLLTNDAAVVAIMQSSGLTKIASNDTDFDRVPGLTRYAPM
ncbi:MAG TPA: type II toxin-antitoxin system VapC family toxin [Gemmataceae bacterium]|jgi:predicted nucleic acid-binding protein